MKVYSLTGRSGTGKSYQAISICKALKIDAIIDDGLFIYKNRVEAGHSAKREKTKVGAIKAAVFVRPEHREEVRSRIREVQPKSILVLGTSDEMTDKICEMLDLPPVSRRIHIEDITTEAERETARKQRDVQGKHVIPAAAPQLKRDFAGYFFNPMKILRESRFFTGGSSSSEKTVVRPTFSYLGEFFISDSVISDIADCVAEEFPFVAGVRKVYENAAADALCISVSIIYKAGGSILDQAAQFQKKLAAEVEAMTAYVVEKVDVEILSIQRKNICSLFTTAQKIK